MKGNDAHKRNCCGNEDKERTYKEDVDEEVGIAASFEEDTHWW